MEEELLSSIDPTTNKVLYKAKNRTYFANGDDINSFYNSRKEQAALVRDQLDSELFNSKFTIEDLAKSEIEILNLEQDEMLAIGREKLLNAEAVHVEFKCKTALQGFEYDVNRLKRDIYQSYKQPDDNVEFVPDAVQTQIQNLLLEGVQVKIYLESAFKIFTQDQKNPHLAKELGKMIDEQTDLSVRFARRVAECGIFIKNEAMQALTLNFSERPKGPLTPEAMKVRLQVDKSTKEGLDKQTLLLELDTIERPRRAFRLANNYSTNFTRYKDLNIVDKGLPAPFPSLGPEDFEDRYIY